MPKVIMPLDWPSATFGLGVVLLLYALWTAVTWYRLRKIPGPRFNSLSVFALSATVYRGKFHLEVQELAEKYGDLFRIGPNHVVSSDIDLARRMGSSKVDYTRGPWYRTFRFWPDVDHSFSMRDEPKHHILRTKLGPGYSGSTAIEVCIENQIRRLTDLIDRKFLSSDTKFRPIEFSGLCHFFAMDVIGDMTFGKPFGFLDNGEDIFGYLKWNEEYFSIMMTMATVPGITKIMYKRPFIWALPKDTDKVGLGRFIAAAKEVVDERIASKADKRRDMVSLFLSQGITRDETVSEAVLQVVGGTDSVATTIRMTLLNLLSSPVAYAKLRREIDDATAAGRLSSPVKDREARQLPYLQAVIREGQRIFPGATPPLFKIVPEEGDTISGYHVPGGTQVAVNIFGMLHSKKYWGDDADLFRPERWLEADAAALERMNQVFEIQFGFGKFKCLGRNIAFMEMSKILPELLRRYDLAMVNASSPVKIVNAGFYLMSDMWVHVTKRQETES